MIYPNIAIHVHIIVQPFCLNNLCTNLLKHHEKGECEYSYTPPPPPPPLPSPSPGVCPPCCTFVQNSRWLEHLGAILKGASDIAAYLVAGDPVLVHCSDGWDRTSQLVSLSQVLLDPYYRTIEGFQVRTKACLLARAFFSFFLSLTRSFCTYSSTMILLLL